MQLHHANHVIQNQYFFAKASFSLVYFDVIDVVDIFLAVCEMAAPIDSFVNPNPSPSWTETLRNSASR